MYLDELICFNQEYSLAVIVFNSTASLFGGGGGGGGGGGAITMID